MCERRGKGTNLFNNSEWVNCIAGTVSSTDCFGVHWTFQWGVKTLTVPTGLHSRHCLKFDFLITRYTIYHSVSGRSKLLLFQPDFTVDILSPSIQASCLVDGPGNTEQLVWCWHGTVWTQNHQNNQRPHVLHTSMEINPWWKTSPSLQPRWLDF